MKAESMTGTKQYSVGVDIGGTFTDLCLIDDTGIVAVGKTLTTHENPALAVEDVLVDTLARAGVDPGDVGRFVHGTTLVTNALIERKGPPTAMLMTEGSRDVPELAREHRYDLYDLGIEKARPLVPRHLRFDVPGRLLADGTRLVPLDEDYLARLGSELHGRGIEAVAVCYLHSYVDPGDELRTREILAEAAPGIRVALSCEVDPEIREYERASTTVANVYVQGLAEDYLADLAGRLRRIGLGCDPRIMLSNGGVATVETAARFPIRMLESGPAGGALGAAAFGRASGRDALMAFDMGGTTAKMCLIEDGEPLVTHEFEVNRQYRLKSGSGLPVKAPVIDMIEIGVGGGSIAGTDALGLLVVGPESAGSEPGPVCYGRGGADPTVTDADLVLGYLGADSFLGGEMSLDLDGARESIRRRTAEPLGLDVVHAAWGIHATVNASMGNAARVHAIERGHDPTGLPLFTYGGAGPVHGAGVAAALHASRVVVPPAAGVLSAAGFLTAPLSFDLVLSRQILLQDLDAGTVAEILGPLEDQGAELLTKSGVEDVRHTRFADLRFAGQGSEVTVELPAASSDWAEDVARRFTAAYVELYGHAVPEDVPVEAITWRVRSSGPVPEAVMTVAAGTDESGRAVVAHRDAFFPQADDYVRTPVYSRYRLAPGTVLDGPALVEEKESTLVVPPGATCRVMPDFSLVVDLDAEPPTGTGEAR